MRLLLVVVSLVAMVAARPKMRGGMGGHGSAEHGDDEKGGHPMELLLRLCVELDESAGGEDRRSWTDVFGILEPVCEYILNTTTYDPSKPPPSEPPPSLPPPSTSIDKRGGANKHDEDDLLRLFAKGGGEHKDGQKHGHHRPPGSTEQPVIHHRGANKHDEDDLLRLFAKGGGEHKDGQKHGHHRPPGSTEQPVIHDRGAMNVQPFGSSKGGKQNGGMGGQQNGGMGGLPLRGMGGQQNGGMGDQQNGGMGGQLFGGMGGQLNGGKGGQPNGGMGVPPLRGMGGQHNGGMGGQLLRGMGGLPLGGMGGQPNGGMGGEQNGGMGGQPFGGMGGPPLRGMGGQQNGGMGGQRNGGMGGQQNGGMQKVDMGFMPDDKEHKQNQVILLLKICEGLAKMVEEEEDVDRSVDSFDALLLLMAEVCQTASEEAEDGMH